MTYGNVGFLGLGNLGKPIAERLCAAGYKLVVYDISDSALVPFTDKAMIATSPLDVGEKAEFVFGCLPTISSYSAAIIGARGLRSGSRIKIYVHIGTTGPGPIEQLAAELNERRIDVVDAPVTGGVPKAREGTLTSMVSGMTKSVDAVIPLLNAYSTKVIRIGGSVGQAQAVKLINNMLSAGNLALACEALAFGVKCGLSPNSILSVVNNGTGMSQASQTKIPEHVLTRKFDYGGSTEITVKDTAAYLKEARRVGAETPLGWLVNELYSLQLSDTGPDSDMTSIAQRFERAAKIEVSES